MKTQYKSTTKAVDYYILWKPCGMTVKAAALQFKIHPKTLSRALARHRKEAK